MAWLQFVLETSEEDADPCSESLMSAGAVAVTFEDAHNNPLFEPPLNTQPLWAHTRVIGLFDAAIDVESVKETLKSELNVNIFNSLKIEPLEDQDWVKTTLSNFQPMQFGKHLWVCPSTSELPKDGLTIILDPGLAFGTGTHPTTRLCLEWLDAHPPKDALVLDYGCGSGILGIAALKSGAKQVLAIDYDPQAISSTQNNAQKNGLRQEEIRALLPSDMPSTLQVDLLLANILANPIIELAPQFATWVKQRGSIVLSGILNTQADTVIQHYKPWFSEFEIASNEEWVRITAHKI